MLTIRLYVKALFSRVLVVSRCRREAVQVRIRRLRPAIREQFRSQETLARTHERQTLQLQDTRLRQVVHAPELAAQTHESARQVRVAAASGRL